mmetsp:Transcript_16977/g.34917  ORF Transcript_16977/g.34917 Transcript_16977/m.34917 type:complete len:210 (+) Transcript_16977:762-1391(+)
MSRLGSGGGLLGFGLENSLGLLVRCLLCTTTATDWFRTADYGCKAIIISFNNLSNRAVSVVVVSKIAVAVAIISTTTSTTSTIVVVAAVVSLVGCRRLLRLLSLFTLDIFADFSNCLGLFFLAPGNPVVASKIQQILVHESRSCRKSLAITQFIDFFKAHLHKTCCSLFVNCLSNGCEHIANCFVIFFVHLVVSRIEVNRELRFHVLGF